MEAKYGPNEVRKERLRANPGDSRLWSHIYDQRDIVSKRSGRCIRYDISVLFFKDQWIKKKLILKDYSIRQILEQLENLKVKDMTSLDGDWNFGVLGSW